MTIEIFYPLYFGSKNPEKRSISIACWKVEQEGLITQVNITHKYKGGYLDGKHIYPTLLCMPTSKVKTYPKILVGKEGKTKTLCYNIPIKDFEHPKFDLKEAQYYEAIKEADKPKLKIETKVEQGTLL